MCVYICTEGDKEKNCLKKKKQPTLKSTQLHPSPPMSPCCTMWVLEAIAPPAPPRGCAVAVTLEGCTELKPVVPGADPAGFPTAAHFPAAVTAHCQPHLHPTGMQTFPKVAARSTRVPQHLSPAPHRHPPPPRSPLPQGCLGTSGMGAIWHSPRAPSCSGHCCKITGKRMGIWGCSPLCINGTSRAAVGPLGPSPVGVGTAPAPVGSLQQLRGRSGEKKKKEGEIVRRNN